MHRYDCKLHYYNENTNNGDRGGGLQESNTTIRHRYVILEIEDLKNHAVLKYYILRSFRIFISMFFLKVSIDSPQKVIL